MTLIIAEAGVNHNGNKRLAFELIDAAVDAGADIIKFQTFKAKHLVAKHAKKADYQIKNSQYEESQFDMLSRLELPFDTHFELVEYCNKLGIEFLSTAFDQESLKFLVDELKIKRLKLPSGELTNSPLVLEHARTNCDLIVSTGMASLAEIEEALGIIAYGYLSKISQSPSRDLFKHAYCSAEGQQILRDKVSILHCTTEYPAPLDEINLNVIDALKTTFGLRVGYSDHTEGVFTPIAAVAKGATIIEKHFTLDKSLDGPDHKASLEPHELNSMIRGIRELEISLGTTVKFPTVSEVKNKIIARKSLVASRDIKKGEIFDETNLAIKRPGYGIEPIQYWSKLGETATQSYKEDDLII